jgi:ANTAR domain-containing protein
VDSEGEFREFLADIREAEADARDAAADARDDAVGALDAAAQDLRARAARDRTSAGRRRRDWVDGLDPTVRRELYPVAAQFADLAGELYGLRDLRDVVDRVVRGALRLVDGADAVSLAAGSGDGYITASATDPLAAELDAVQFGTGRGPVLEAVRVPGVGLAFAADLDAAGPWPELAVAARARGVRGVLSVALFPTGGPPRLGALTFYAREAGALVETDHDTAIVLAAYAGTALAAVGALESADQDAEHLRRALDARDVIGQAKGILMERRGLSAEQAFGVLSETSQQLNVKVRDLAEQVAEGAGQGR